MSVPPTDQTGGPAKPRHRLWLGLGVLFLLEVLWLSVRFDTTPLLKRSSLWAEVVGYSPAFMGVMFAVAAATVLAFSTSEVSQLPGPAVVPKRSAAAVGWLAGHLASFGAFYVLSRVVLETDLDASPIGPVPWLVLWFCAGVLTVVLLAAAALPLRRWWQILTTWWQMLTLAVLIGFLGWAGGQIAEASWSPLHRPTFVSVQAILDWLGQNVISNPESFEIGIAGAQSDFRIIIDQSCSGYQGIGLIVVFLSAFFWLDRKDLKFPNALILLPLAAVFIWILNVLRISGLLLVGAFYSREVALGGFHSQVGWLSFLSVALGTVLVLHRVDAFSKGSDHKTWSGLDHPEVAHLLPFVALLTMTMVSTALTGDFDWLYPLRVMVVGVVLWVFWRHLLPLRHGDGYWTLAALGLGVAAGLLWLAVALSRPQADEGVTLGMVSASMPASWFGLWVAFKLVGTLVIVPISEELAFRGYLTRKLISRDFDAVTPGTFTWPSFLISSLAFGLLHSLWIEGFLVGMLFALAYYHRGRLIDAVVAHSVANLILTAYVWTTGDWGLW